MAESDDYYALLGVVRTASDGEIKKAYHQKAMAYHPDRNSNPDAEKKFKEINEAYDVLKDPQKRQMYDQYGKNAFGGHAGSGAAGAAPFGDFSGFDIFSELFGFGTAGQRTRSAAVAGRDLQHDVQLSLEEAFSGKNITLDFTVATGCDHCGGTGSRDKAEAVCPQCNGAGMQTRQQGFVRVQMPCGQCHGTGKIIKNPCVHCGGLGRVNRKKHVDVNIPAGVDNGTRIRLREQGEAGARGGRPGDLYVAIHIKPHAVFERREETLSCAYTVPFTFGLIGGLFRVVTIDGQSLEIKVPAGMQSGTRLRAAGYGMPSLKRGSRRGDLMITVKLETPVKLDARQRELVEELQKSFKPQQIPQSANL